ncbi:MAG: Rieske 2Fe-2S domain-containing protein [Dehalococcoidia bacterium]|nr:Rieske 2Fe-2S domain-containing protein [Dehalococcoidia bacterium]
MGTLLRRFWIPVLLTEELPEPDGEPVAVRIMGEDLVAYKDTNGKVGLLDGYCAHRHAHLYWSRNEECGLRCTYHGWKYDTEGNCIDMPNEPAESNFKDKIKINSYPTREWGGAIWAYMGPPELMPPELPQFEWARVADNQRIITKRLQESNWAQAVEGGIDSSHISFLHGGKPPAIANLPENQTVSTRDTSPRFWISHRDFGFAAAARRNAPEEQYYWRITPYLAPWYTIIPGGAAENRSLSGHAWVPIDDTHVFTFTMTWNPSRPITDEERETHLKGFGVHTEVDKVMPRWELKISNGYTPIRNMSNNYMVDFEERRLRTFTGIKGISEQDMSIQESMWPMVPRWKEHLGTTDKAIIEFRKLVMGMARDLLEGKEPEFPHTPDAYRVRSAAVTIGRDIAWEEGSAEVMKARV